jgi:hypothetical protein
MKKLSLIPEDEWKEVPKSFRVAVWLTDEPTSTVPRAFSDPPGSTTVCVNTVRTPPGIRLPPGPDALAAAVTSPDTSRKPRTFTPGEPGRVVRR